MTWPAVGQGGALLPLRLRCVGFLDRDDKVRSNETASGEAASFGGVMMADKRSVLRVRRRF